MIYNITGGLNADPSELSNDASKILTGYSFIGSSGEKVDGAMPNRGSSAGISLTVTNSSKTVIYGYYPSQFVINVSNESLSAYSGGIPIEILSESNTDVSTGIVRGSNDKFLKEVTGVPSNIRVGFLNSNDSIISSATNITSTIGGLNILPGKSLGVKYKAGATTYTYKVNSALTYDNVNNKGRSIGFSNIEGGSEAVTLTPGTDQIFNTIEFVPNVIALYTKGSISEPSAVDIIESSNRILDGSYAIVEVKSGSNTAVKKYIKGTYTPKLQSRNIPLTTFSGNAATSINVKADSGYEGLSQVNYCPSNIRVRMFSNSDLSSLSNVSLIDETNTILSGWNAVVGVKDSASIKYGYYKGTHSTSAKSLKNLMKITHFSSAADSYTTYSAASGSSFSSITNVPVNISLQFYTDAALSSLTCAKKTSLWTSSYIKSGQNLVARIRYGNTDSTDLYVYYIEGSGS